MAALPTIPQTIERGYASISIAGNYNSKSSLFYGGKLNPVSPTTIMVYTYALDWGYTGGAQSAQSLRQFANYLNWLMGMFGNQAAVLIAGGGGGSVTPITPGVATPTRLDFIVGASSFLPTGTTTFTFPATWEGLNIDFVRNGIPQSAVTSESSWFTFNRSTREFECSPALNAGELISIIPS
jgi:hypothetical protein